MKFKHFLIMLLVGSFSISYIATEVFGYGILNSILLVTAAFIIMYKITKLEVTD